MGTKSQQQVILNKLSDNEECFLLRAQDALAPQIIRAWARALQAQTGTKHIVPDESHVDYELIMSLNKIIDLQEAKAQEALDCADRMEQWPNRKIPD